MFRAELDILRQMLRLVNLKQVDPGNSQLERLPAPESHLEGLPAPESHLTRFPVKESHPELSHLIAAFLIQLVRMMAELGM